MNFEAFSDDSKVWVYQSDRRLTATETAFCDNEISTFVQNWSSHNNELNATGCIMDGLFLILMVDESRSVASGCSIDSSVKFVKSLETILKVNFFERMNFAYQNERGEAEILPSQEFSKAYQAGILNDDTIVYDNLVQTKSDFLSSWKKMLKSSWHRRFV